MLIPSETGGVRVYEAASWQSINLGKFGTPHVRVARLQKYSKISLVRYLLFGRAYRNTNGIVIPRVTC